MSRRRPSGPRRPAPARRWTCRSGGGVLTAAEQPVEIVRLGLVKLRGPGTDIVHRGEGPLHCWALADDANPAHDILILFGGIGAEKDGDVARPGIGGDVGDAILGPTQP